MRTFSLVLVPNRAMRWLPLLPALLAVPLWHANAAPPDDWCKTAKLPSSIVICGDPDLLALATERDRVFEDVRARLSQDQRKVLLADQKQWIKAYAAECGVAQNAPPPNPVPDSVKACFKQAGQARLAYLRSYQPPGLSGSASSSTEGAERQPPASTAPGYRSAERLARKSQTLSRISSATG